MQLAQIAMLLDAMVRPGRQQNFGDYLVRPRSESPEESDAEMSPEAVDALCKNIGFLPRPKRRTTTEATQ